MKKYRCKKRFCVDKYDDDGFLIPNEVVIVEEGDVYSLDESGATIIGGEVHLDGEDGSWLELSMESLEEFFEEVSWEGSRMEYDSETKKWLRTHPGHQTTVCRCEKCGLYYKPILGHKCKIG